MSPDDLPEARHILKNLLGHGWSSERVLWSDGLAAGAWAGD